MELSAAILGRRTIKDFKPDPVPGDVLERALTAGLWAQNHQMTEPWRFTIFGPETQRRLAEAIAGGAVDADKFVLSRPLIVAVSQVLAGDDNRRKEDYAAIACAIQNVQLAAWAEGLGMQWSSGKLARFPGLPGLLGIDPQAEEIVGLLFFGFPARVPAALPRKPLSEVSRQLP